MVYLFRASKALPSKLPGNINNFHASNRIKRDIKYFTKRYELEMEWRKDEGTKNKLRAYDVV